MRRALGLLFLAGPFVAGAVAAASARHDLRLIAMGAVAAIAAWLVRPSANGVGRIAFAFAVATAAAAAIAIVAGARAPFGVIAVAVVIAGFATVGAVLLSPV